LWWTRIRTFWNFAESNVREVSTLTVDNLSFLNIVTYSVRFSILFCFTTFILLVLSENIFIDPWNAYTIIYSAISLIIIMYWWIIVFITQITFLFWRNSADNLSDSGSDNLPCANWYCTSLSCTSRLDTVAYNVMY